MKKRPKKGEPIRAILWLLGAVILDLQWVFLQTTGSQLDSPWNAILPGLGIFGAAFLLSWGAELAQLEISQALALALLALVAVLPEYAVDIYFAWTGGKNPAYIHFALANMTGSNRLLIGLGWPAIIFAYWWKTRKSYLILERSHGIEISALLLATVYSFILPLKGALSAVDSVFFIGIFVLYIVRASRAHVVEPELSGPSELMASIRVPLRRLATILLFAVSGFTIYIAAKPFAEGLLSAGREFGIEEFILVQWLAPLASESPEFIVAIIFALRMLPGLSFGTLVSSKVNQWTLLVGMLPLAFSLSLGSLGSMVLDPRQTEEIFLTSAQSLFAVAVISNFRFSLLEALVLFILFSTQLFFPSSEIRYIYAVTYFILACGIIIFSSGRRGGLNSLIRGVIGFVERKQR